MALKSPFQRDVDATGAEGPDAVAAARQRARRRLIGATVLLGIGVLGFPLLFENQPRPIPVDIPIEIPRKETTPPVVLPATRPAPPVTVAEPPLEPVAPSASEAAPARPPVAAVAVPASKPPAVITERAAEQGRERPAAVAPSAPAANDGTRAKALLDGRADAERPAAAASGSRVVVQVGAYIDADKLRDARSKVEQLGFKTYTQVIEADGAKRTRVRIGPFASRDEAEKAAARVKAAGLPTAILTL